MSAVFEKDKAAPRGVSLLLRVAPLLLLRLDACAAAARARSVPSWLTFYGLNASEQHAWANLATSVAHGVSKAGVGGGALSVNGSLLSAWREYRMPGMLDIEDIAGGFDDGLWIRRGYNTSHVNPQWKTLLNPLLDDAMPWLEAGALRGIFLGDEVCCGGIPVSDLQVVASYVKGRINHTGAFLYVNECEDTFAGLGGNLNQKGIAYAGYIHGANALPAAIDYVSADIYTPNEATESVAAKAVYERLIYPTLHPHQRVWLVPGLFGDVNTSQGVMEEILVQKLAGYWNWSLADDRIAGLNPWHWTTWPPKQLQPLMRRGAREFPRLSAPARGG
jgi:hypothetical protein